MFANYDRTEPFSEFFNREMEMYDAQKTRTEIDHSTQSNEQEPSFECKTELLFKTKIEESFGLTSETSNAFTFSNGSLIKPQHDQSSGSLFNLTHETSMASEDEMRVGSYTAQLFA